MTSLVKLRLIMEATLNANMDATGIKSFLAYP